MSWCSIVVLILLGIIAIINVTSYRDLFKKRGQPITADKLKTYTVYRILARHNEKMAGGFNQLILVREFAEYSDKPVIALKLFEPLKDNVTCFSINSRYNAAGFYMTGESAIFSS